MSELHILYHKKDSDRSLALVDELKQRLPQYLDESGFGIDSSKIYGRENFKQLASLRDLPASDLVLIILPKRKFRTREYQDLNVCCSSLAGAAGFCLYPFCLSATAQIRLCTN